MQTALHIQTVTAEARRELTGAEFYSSEFYRKERAAYLFFSGSKKKFALGLQFHPLAHGAFFVPAGKVRYDTPEKPFPFFQELYGAKITLVEHVAFDRIIKLTLESGDSGASVSYIIVEALGPSGTLWLLDSSRCKQAVLRHRKFSTDETYELPGAGKRLAAFDLDGESLRGAFNEYMELEITGAIRKSISGFDETLCVEALRRAQLAPDSPVSHMCSDDYASLAETLCAMTSLAAAGQSGYLYAAASPPSAQPFKLKSANIEPEKFPSYSLAFLALGKLRQAAGGEIDEEKRIGHALKRALKKQQRTITKIEGEFEDYQGADRYRELADILKAHLSGIKKGLKSVTLPDLYGEGDVTVALDPKLSGADNADRYYKKYQKGREGLALTERRLNNARQEFERLEEIAEAFEHDADSARVRFVSEFASLTSGGAAVSRVERAPRAPRLPYRDFATSTGLKVIVGRDGTDNDDTTFKHIKPYELWFHASQCAGSHVGLKFPSKSFVPSKTEIQETAEIAAWFSKARNNASAPVNYTQRRYVRKPRKAKPGLVTIEREKTIMVVPQKPSV